MNILVVQESDWIKRNPHQQHHLMERLVERGHCVHVIDYPIDWSLEKDGGLINNEERVCGYSKIIDGVDITVTRPSFIRIKGLNYLSMIYTHKKAIKDEVQDFKPDVIVGLGLLNTYAASKIAQKNNIPFIYYVIDNLYALIPEKPLQIFGKKVFKKTLKNTTLTLSINKKLQELTIKNGTPKNKTQVIPAGIDLKKYKPQLKTKLKEKYQIKETDTTLFFMGYIYHFAGIKELAKKIGQEKHKHPHIKLLIVGDGEAYQDLKEIQEKYNLQDQLILTGRQPYNLVPEFLTIADYCLLPAYQDEEIMQDIVPIKIYEYLAMGKPVISTLLPGIHTEFQENNGVIYINQAEEIPELIKTINPSKYEEISKQGLSYVKNNDWEKITDEFEETLKKLI